ncbi:MAG: hypothetical protein WD377_06980 [Nitriliruptoraceae bacterium]
MCKFWCQHESQTPKLLLRADGNEGHSWLQDRVDGRLCVERAVTALYGKDNRTGASAQLRIGT